MSDRYKAVKTSGHGCCFEASVMRQARQSDPDILVHDGMVVICECSEMRDAEQIAAALNATDTEGWHDVLAPHTPLPRSPGTPTVAKRAVSHGGPPTLGGIDRSTNPDRLSERRVAVSPSDSPWDALSRMISFRADKRQPRRFSRDKKI